MELLDRYLEAVRKHLPWQRQDDIAAELRANLEAQLEEKEAALGRPLSQAEAEAWLKQLGSPMQMAAPFQAQQYLIGPGFFPIYRNVMRIALTWAIIIFSIVNTVTLLLKEPGDGGIIHALVSTLLNMPEVLLQVAAWITLVFAALEFAVVRHAVKLPDGAGPFAGWSTGTLPPVAASKAEGKKQPSYAKAVAEAIFGFIFLIWLLLLPRHPFLWLGPGVYFIDNLPYRAAPVWMNCYWLLVALHVVQLVWHSINLISGRWKRPQTALLLVSKAIVLMATVLLLESPGHLTVLLKNPAADAARYGSTLNSINRSIFLSAEVFCAVIALQVIWHIAQLSLQTYRRRSAAL